MEKQLSRKEKWLSNPLLVAFTEMFFMLGSMSIIGFISDLVTPLFSA